MYDHSRVGHEYVCARLEDGKWAMRSFRSETAPALACDPEGGLVREQEDPEAPAA
jgi:hypothetical protein